MESKELQREEQFQKMQFRVANLLTVNDVQAIILLRPGISLAEQGRIKTGIDLMLTLRRLGRLTSSNVDTLIKWVEEIKHLQALEVIKNYKKTYLVASSSTKCSKENHESYWLDRYCNTCEISVCPLCVCDLHLKSECDVLVIRELPEKIQTEKENIKEALGSVEKQLATAEEECIKNWELKSRCVEHSRSQITKDASRLIEEVKEKETATLKKLSEIEKEDSKECKSETNDLSKLKDDMKNVHTLLKCKEDDPLTEWCKIQSTLKQITETSHVVTKIQERKHNFLYSCVPNGGTFCKITSCLLVGGVMVDTNRCVTLYDQRIRNGYLLMVCVDPKLTHKEHWRDTLKVEDHSSPVVMSHRSLYHQSQRYVIFAIGNTAYIGDCKDGRFKCSSTLIDDVSKQSWITSISSVRTSTNEFVMSYYNSQRIKKYKILDVELNVMEVENIDLGKASRLSAGISSLGSSEEILAAIEYGSENVTLFKFDGTLHATINPPEVGLVPVVAVWTAISWLILYIRRPKDGKGNEKTWILVEYKRDLEIVKIQSKGIAHGSMEVPISVTHWKNDGFINFNDDTIRHFEF